MNRYLIPIIVIALLVGGAYWAYQKHPQVGPLMATRSDREFAEDQLGRAKRQAIIRVYDQRTNYKYVDLNKVTSLADLSDINRPPEGETSIPDNIGIIVDPFEGQIIRYYTETHQEQRDTDNPNLPSMVTVTIGYVEMKFNRVRLILQENLPFATIKERLQKTEEDNNSVKVMRIMTRFENGGASVSPTDPNEIIIRGTVMDIERLPADYNNWLR